MRIVRTFIFLFLLLAAVLGITRFFFLDQLTILALDRSGLQDADIHFSTLNPGRTEIDTLQATFRLPSGELLPVSLHDVSLRYSLRQLLTTGKCSRISIGTLKIKRTPPNTTSATATLSLPRQITLLRDDLRSRLPLQELRINQMLLSGDFPEQVRDKSIQLHALVNKTEVTADLRLQLTKNTVITVTMDSVDAHQATAVLTGMQGKEEILKTTVTLTPDELAADIDLQLQPVQDLLQQTTALREQVRVDGNLTAHFTLPLPLLAGDNIRAEVTLLDHAGHQIQLTADGNPKTEKLSLLFSGQKRSQQFMQAELTLEGRRIKGSYQFQAASLTDFLQPYFQQQLPAVSGSFKGSVDIPLPGSANSSFQLTAQATSPGLRTFSSGSARLQLSGKLADKTLHLDKESQLHAEKLNLGTAQMDTLALDLAGTLSRVDNKILLGFATGRQLAITGLTAGKITVDRLETAAKFPLQISSQQGTWSAGADAFQIQPFRAAYGPNKLTVGPMACTLSRLEKNSTGTLFDATLATPSLVFNGRGLELPLQNLSATVQLNRNKLKGTLQVAPQSIPGRFKAAFSHDLSTAAGSFSLRTDRRLDLDQEGTSLAQLLTPWQYPFNLEQGKISVKANGSWAVNQKFKLAAFTAVTGGSGFYKQFLFNGLNIRQDLAVLPRLFSKTEGSFALHQLIGAVDIHNIRAGLNFIPSKKGSLPKVKISDFNASLFAGNISSPTILYDLNQPDSSFTVTLNNLDLATMMKMIQMDSLQISGRISGDIPISIKGKTVTVDNGNLHSEPPGGEIQYTPENMNQTGVTGYALKAVEDFRYNSLKTTAEYLPSGQLNLDIGLQGISPGLSTTRPVHLNIHAEQNLPSLLQSLRFSKGLTEELDKRLKQHYK